MPKWQVLNCGACQLASRQIVCSWARALLAELTGAYVLACSWVKCDPIDILREVDDSYFSHVEDRRFTKYEADLTLRLADFTA